VQAVRNRIERKSKPMTGLPDRLTGLPDRLVYERNRIRRVHVLFDSEDLRCSLDLGGCWRAGFRRR
jgi:hypothetical protein